MIPPFEEPLQLGANGVMQPATAAAALGLGHDCSDAPEMFTQFTMPGEITQTWLALLHEI